LGEAIEMLQRIRSGFSLEADFGADLDTATIVDGFVAIIEPHATDDFECVMDGGALVTRYEGLDGLRTGWTDFLGGFETLAIEPGEVRERDGAVLEFVRLTGRPKGVTASIEADAAAVWRLRDGKLAAVEFHMDRERAMRSAGLDKD
jgi:hypothetical protein